MWSEHRRARSTEDYLLELFTYLLLCEISPLGGLRRRRRRSDFLEISGIVFSFEGSDFQKNV